MLREFKEFALRGNVIDLAVGIVIGAAFNQVINSLVNDIIMPPFGLMLGKVNFSNLYLNLSGKSYPSLAAARAAGAVTIDYGLFINNLINFLIVALVIFLLIRWINRLHHKPPQAPDTKPCPFCRTTIPLKATRCPNCTSKLAHQDNP